MFRFPILLVLAALPVFALMSFVYIGAGRRKLSMKLMVLLGVLGGISTIPAAILEATGDIWLLRTPMSEDIKNLIELFLIVGVVEELGKYVSLVFLTWKHPNFQHSYSAIAYSVSASLGFALVENILYVLMGGFAVGVLRAFTAVPLHCMVAILMGFLYAIGREAAYQKQKGKCILFMFLSYLVPVLVHGFYDFVTTKAADSIAYFGLFGLVVLAILLTGLFLLIYASKKNHRLDGKSDPLYQDIPNAIPYYYPPMPYGSMSMYGGMQSPEMMPMYGGMQPPGMMPMYGGMQPPGMMPMYGGMQPPGMMPMYGGMQSSGMMPMYGEMQPYGGMPVYGEMQIQDWNYGYPLAVSEYYAAAGYMNPPENIDIYGVGNPKELYAPGKDEPAEKED